MLYADPALRPSSDTIRRGGGGPAALWAQGISGDLPIVLVRIDDIEDIAIVRQLLRAHEYWRMKQLAVDLVILNERGSSYIQDLQAALETQVRTSQSRPQIGADGARGAVFVLRADLVPAATRALLLATARAVLVGRRGTLAEQLARPREAAAVPPPPKRVRAADATPAAPVQQLEFFNGLGGFAADGREYVTILGAGQSAPAPWINVVANPAFGFQVAAEGSGYTWSGSAARTSSRRGRTTRSPTGRARCSTCATRTRASCGGRRPIRSATQAVPYVARHGAGYSRFEHAAHGIALDLLQYVPLDDPVKISRLTIRNTSRRARRLSVTAYVEWVLGPSRGASALSVVTEIDPETGAMFARNPWNVAFGARVAFADLAGRQIAWTGDRREFLGRNGTLDNPAALAADAPLSQRVGAGLDPCGALQAPVELEPGDAAEIVFLLGQARDGGRRASADRPLPDGRSRRGPARASSTTGTTRSARSR